MSKFGVFLFEGFQEMEFWYPVLRLREIGADVVVIGVDGKGAAASVLQYPVVPDAAMADVKPADFAALVVPGGKVEALSANKPFRDFLDQASASGSRILTVSQAASLATKAIVARTTDDVPHAMRTLLSEISQ